MDETLTTQEEIINFFISGAIKNNINCSTHKNSNDAKTKFSTIELSKSRINLN